MKMTPIERVRRAVIAFISTPQYLTSFAVIYDVRQKNGDDSEEYYESFISPDEAKKMFNEAFGSDDTIHNARLVLILDTIKEQRD